MTDLYEERLGSVSGDLAWLEAAVMFFGAGVLPLYLDRGTVGEDLRPTEDVDALVQLSVIPGKALQTKVQWIEERLRDHGWAPDLRPHRRNRHAYVSPSGIAVDFAFAELYPPDDWPVVAQETAVVHELSKGRSVRIPTPALYLEQATERHGVA